MLLDGPAIALESMRNRTCRICGRVCRVCRVCSDALTRPTRTGASGGAHGGRHPPLVGSTARHAAAAQEPHSLQLGALEVARARNEPVDDEHIDRDDRKGRPRSRRKVEEPAGSTDTCHDEADD